MISLCSVTLPCIEPFLEITLNKILAKKRLVKEILICDVKQPSSYLQTQEIDGTPIIKFGIDLPPLDHGSFFDQSSEHALAIHECIQKSQYDYILLNDPDAYWHSSVDEIYYTFMQQYNLNLIGCAKINAATFEAAGYFTNPFSMMFRKQDLPGPDYMEDELVLRNGTKVPGRIFIPPLKFVNGELDWYNGKPRFDISDYPNPNGFCDTGSILMRWAKDQKWKWLSFLNGDEHNYYTKWSRSEPRITERLPYHKLLYHQISSVNRNEVQDFIKATVENEDDG